MWISKKDLESRIQLEADKRLIDISAKLAVSEERLAVEKERSAYLEERGTKYSNARADAVKLIESLTYKLAEIAKTAVENKSKTVNNVNNQQTKEK